MLDFNLKPIGSKWSLFPNRCISCTLRIEADDVRLPNILDITVFGFSISSTELGELHVGVIG